MASPAPKVQYPASCSSRTPHEKGSRRLAPRTFVTPPSSYTRQKTTSSSSPADRLPGRVDLLDFGLLSPQLLMNRLDVIVALFPQRDLLDHASNLVDERVLLGFDHLERTVRPIDVCQFSRLRDRLAQQLGVLLMQGDILSDVAFGREPTNACPPGFDHLFTHLQLLLCQTEGVPMNFGQFRRYRHRLVFRQRHRSDGLGRRFDLRGG